MALKIKQASKGKIFAYKDENNVEQLLGSTLYLAKNDSGEQYYEVDDPTYKPEPEVVENPDYKIE